MYIFSIFVLVIIMIEILNEVVVNIDSNCYGFDAIVRVIKDGVFPIIQIAIPIITAIKP